MTAWSNIVSPARGRTIVIVLGGLYVLLGAGLLVTELSRGRAVTNILLVSLFVTVPGVVLLGGGYRLPDTDVETRYYPIVAGWCLGGLGLMFASLALYQLEPAESISDPARGFLVLTAFGAVAGFGVGSRDALAKTHARRVRHRNAKLERTRVELEETVGKLEESNERLDQFASLVSHDLQEPLRMVTNYLSLLETRYGDRLDGEGREFLEFAIDGADRMGEMIDGLLELSRVQTRGESFRTVELGEVLEDVQRDLEMQILETDATVEVGDLHHVEGDPDQLRQLFQNLVGNALEYSGDEPPRVTVSARRHGDSRVTVAVRDEGIGMDPDDTDRIFQVFQRLHSREENDGTGTGTGTGIGLALCRRIVERHGGDINVDSEPGEGSTFHVTLPAPDRPHADP